MQNHSHVLVTSIASWVIVFFKCVVIDHCNCFGFALQQVDGLIIYP